MPHQFGIFVNFIS